MPKPSAKSVTRTTTSKNARNSKPHPLPAGTKAPVFSLKTTPDQSISLSDFKGKPVILVFYPADWSPVCGDELAVFNQVLPEFKKYDAQLLGISVDSAWSHVAYEQSRNLHFPLLSDYNPKGEVAAKYGVYLPKEGEAARALFVIDGKGVIRWSYLSPIGVSPGADGILNALEDLQRSRTERQQSGAQRKNV
jgi:peroxiredoxin (alkyl hydroperoxide reductase subunit C)